MVEADAFRYGRPRQLHGPSNLLGKSSAQPTSSAVRLLAACRRLNRHRAACLLRRHLHRVLRGHLSRARQPRLGGRMGQLRHLPRMAAVGLVGWPGERRRDRRCSR